MKKRGLAIAPEIAVGDGAMGFWKALEEIFPSTRHQRCWQHKMLNVLNKAPNSVQSGMKEALRQVRDAPDRATAEAAIDTFAQKYQAKYSKAVECLTKDREPLLAFLDFPAEPLRSLLAAPVSWIGSKACWPLMGPSAHRQPDRKCVRHGPPSIGAYQRRTVAQDRETDGLQAGHGRLENLAAIEG